MLVSAAAYAVTSSAMAESRREQPQAIRARVSQLSLNCRLVTDTEERFLKRSGTFEEFEKEVLSPSLSMNIVGSIYHSKLISFYFGGHSGLSIEDTSGNLPSLNEGKGSIEVFDYNFRTTFLSAKPYPLSIYSSRGTSRRDYDQFTRVTYERDTVGADWSLQNAFAPLRISWESWSEETIDEIRIDRREESLLDMRAVHDSAGGDRTSLRYLYRDFSEEEDVGDADSGQIHSADIIDERALNEKRKATLRSSMYYRSVTRGDRDDRSLLLRENYKGDYSENSQLSAVYLLDYRAQGAFDSQRHYAEASLKHQLYESLTSTFSLEASTSSVGGEGVDDGSSAYGGSVSELYKKKLGDWGKLRVNLGLKRRDENRTSGTASTAALREAVVLTDGETVLLDSPGIVPETVEVTDSAGGRIYRRNVDYLLIQRGEFLEIQRAIGGEIPNGSTVWVSYLATADAEVNVSMLSGYGRASVSLFDDLLEVYGSTENTGYDGDTSVAYEDSDRSEAGISLGYKWFRAGFSFESYESDSIVYDSMRSYQSFSLRPWGGAYIDLQGDQVSNKFTRENSEQTIDTYSFRYTQGIGSSLSLAGTMSARGEVQDDVRSDSSSFDVRCDYNVGKLKVNLSHYLTSTDTDTERRDKGKTIIRVERRFW